MSGKILGGGRTADQEFLEFYGNMNRGEGFLFLLLGPVILASYKFMLV